MKKTYFLQGLKLLFSSIKNRQWQLTRLTYHCMKHDYRKGWLFKEIIPPNPCKGCGKSVCYCSNDTYWGINHGEL